MLQNINDKFNDYILVKILESKKLTLFQIKESVLEN